MNPRHSWVALRAGHRCEYCHAPEVVFNFTFEVEHITPVARAGDSAETNLGLACRSCNAHKAASVIGKDPVTQDTVRLFHPREDQWSEHFLVDEETAMIVGLTDVGRATAGRLAMNSPEQCAARRQWMLLGLFP